MGDDRSGSGGALGIRVSSPGITASIELSGTGTVAGASDSAGAVLGEDLTGRPFADLLSPDDREYWQLTAGADTSEGFAGLFLHRPGSDAPEPRLIVTEAVRSGAGGWLLSARAPTPDDVRVARALRSARFEIVGRIASGVAHELNNILSTVTTFSDLLLARMSRDPSVVADLTEIRDAAVEASHVLRKLDMFAGGRSKGVSTVHVQDVLAGMDKLLRRFVPPGVEVEVDVAPDCPPVHVDPLRLEEALFALLADARDAVGSGGRLRVSADAAPASGTAAACVRLRVEHLSPSEAEHDPAGPPADAHAPGEGAEPHDRGTGLGNNLVHRFVAAAGGRLRSTPTTSGGATAWIELPAHGEEPAVIGG